MLGTAWISTNAPHVLGVDIRVIASCELVAVDELALS